jgi:hypothetical protein
VEDLNCQDAGRFRLATGRQYPSPLDLHHRLLLGRLGGSGCSGERLAGGSPTLQLHLDRGPVGRELGCVEPEQPRPHRIVAGYPVEPGRSRVQQAECAAVTALG